MEGGGGGGGGGGARLASFFRFLVPSTVAKHFIWHKVILSKSKGILDLSDCDRLYSSISEIVICSNDGIVAPFCLA